ncbi:nucleotide-binding universal stress UspA family protein [Streptacidiphilus sp. MAP12-20]|uniref:universal stress protein n=1 Tax=Streptacidiphilus sp. MAP12-20 TaxID=3156299 RepID=UPI003515D7AF
MTEPGRIVVGVSGTPTSLQALRVAVAETRRTGVALRAVLAWAPPGGELSYRRAPCPPLLRFWEDEAAWRLRNCFDEAFGAVPHDVPVQLDLVRSDPGAALVDSADRPEDLLVVGAGARGTVTRLFHGATTRYCVANAGCRVLTVPPPALLSELPRRLRHSVPAPPQEILRPPLTAPEPAPGESRSQHNS